LVSPGPVVRGTKFISGDDELKPFAKDLETFSFADWFPEATEIRLLRRVRLSCTHATSDCRLQLIPAQSISTDDIAPVPSSTAGDVPSIRIGGNAAAAKLLKRVQPGYPEVARSARISGVVRLHVIIAKDGTVTQVQVVSGHPMLIQAAIDAVLQWVYEPTLLQGNPVEVVTTVDTIFSLNQ
jgi:TonB family protein